MSKIVITGFGTNQLLVLQGYGRGIDTGFRTCQIWERVKYADNEPRHGEHGYANIVAMPYNYEDKLFTNPTPDGVVATSDATGLMSWTIVWGAIVGFEVDAAGIGKTVIIPEVDSIRLSDIQESN